MAGCCPSCDSSAVCPRCACPASNRARPGESHGLEASLQQASPPRRRERARVARLRRKPPAQATGRAPTKQTRCFLRSEVLHYLYADVPPEIKVTLLFDYPGVPSSAIIGN